MPTLTVLSAKKLRDLRDDQAREPVLKRGYLRKQSEKLKVWRCFRSTGWAVQRR